MGSIRAASCDSDDPRQVFEHFPIVGTHCSAPTHAGGCWYQRSAYLDSAGVLHEAECLSARVADAHQVTGVRCTEEERYLRWKVVPKT